MGRLLEAFGGSVDRALGGSLASWCAVPGIGEVTARKAMGGIAAVEARATEEIDLVDRAGASLLARGEAGYPTLLASLPDAPWLLYVRGSLEANGADRYPVAIVGSRRCTAYGIEQGERFGGVLGRAGLTIVSGGARGIDTAAHRGSLRSGGRTVVVQGCGLSVCFPPENETLLEKIVREGAGAILSELPMRAEPRGEQFPARNRIISGMSLGVVVIEAGRKSGALITARLAAEDHGREVMVLPGRVDSPASMGSLELLKQGGGSLVTEPGDVLALLETPARFVHEGLHESRYDDPARSEPRVSGSVNGDSGLVLDSLALGELEPDEIARRTGLGADRVRVALTLLELGGGVVRKGTRFGLRGR
jgi:DNA processing protein